MKNTNIAQLGRFFGAKTKRSRVISRLFYGFSGNTEVL